MSNLNNALKQIEQTLCNLLEGSIQYDIYSLGLCSDDDPHMNVLVASDMASWIACESEDYESLAFCNFPNINPKAVIYIHGHFFFTCDDERVKKALDLCKKLESEGYNEELHHA